MVFFFRLQQDVIHFQMALGREKKLFSIAFVDYLAVEKLFYTSVVNILAV